MKPRLLTILLLLLAGAVAACLTGCPSSITPPGDPTNPVSVFLLDYGRHSSLAFPTDGEHTLVEYAYGDWNWFALDESEWHDVFPTLFWPTQGALGRRVLCVEPTPASVLQAVGCEEVLEITVSGCAVTDLARELDGQFDDRIETLHYQPLYELAFVHTEKPFHLFHNCNHAVAEWLRKVGCQVRGPTILADFSVGQR